MMKSSISEIFQLNVSRIFFEMHNVYIIWFSSLLFSNLLHANLCLFVFGADFAASNWKIISICSCWWPVFWILSIRGLAE